MLDKEQLSQLESVNSKLLKINQEMLIELRKTKFDKEAVLKELERIRHIDDVESIHVKADGILCQCLAELGYPEIGAAFNKIPRWYA